MPPPRRSPTLRRRRLTALLNQARKDAGLSTVDIDARLGWNKGKTARAMRGEWVRPNPRDIRDMLDLLGVTDERRREEMFSLARQGRERGWWHPYREMLSERYTTYIGLEAEAGGVLTFEALRVPGLLQTIDYARALMKDGPAELGDEEIEKRIEVRTERQKPLTASEQPLRLWAIMDESVITHAVGGAAVMRDQLNHLLKMAELPKVTLQIIPLAVGAHPGMNGPFTILEFPEPLDPDAVYTENIGGELLQEEPADVARFKTAFQRLQGSALAPKDTLALIADKAATL